jgi:hypothetical protein
MTELEVWIDLVAALLVLAGLIFGVVRYSQEKKRDFQRRFFEQQLAIYRQAVEYAAVIATHPKRTPTVDSAILKFKTLYWGEMCLVEDREVEKSMRKFMRVLSCYEKDNDPLNDIQIQETLEHFAMVLAHTCRNSSIGTWDIEYEMQRFNDHTQDESGDKAKIAELELLTLPR